ncbi:UBN2 domain-containing protein [Cephalotus follicularis]|uniref:UBN2 domain-containing protein n=1 Tax=Cephalotus follicularis TaxID=3775 RepID=A0A1Q3CZB4_CEPFO|nr:UBN2 domain-containing protein [Cephalotus follicularis]
MQLKYQLLQLKCGTMSISDCLYKVNGIVANLATSANPVSKQDTILSILRGLRPEYDSFATSITAWLDPISLDEFIGLLLNQEILKEQAAPHLDLSPILTLKVLLTLLNPPLLICEILQVQVITILVEVA